MADEFGLGAISLVANAPKLMDNPGEPSHKKRIQANSDELSHASDPGGAKSSKSGKERPQNDGSNDKLFMEMLDDTFFISKEQEAKRQRETNIIFSEMMEDSFLGESNHKEEQATYHKLKQS